MWKDRAIVAILAANLLTLVIAVWQSWPLTLVLWPYWIQSVIIGYYARRRILKLENFCTKGFLVNGQSVQPTAATQRSIAFLFTIHYGGFHLVYLTFLLIMGATPEGGGDQPASRFDQLFILLAGLSFWFSHGYSHRQHLASDLRHVRKLGTLMFVPYVRIVPMHFTLMLGLLLQVSGLGLALFMLLKTAADVAMHKIEHRMLAGPSPASPAASEQ